MRSWYIPAALSALVIGLVASMRRPGPMAGDVVAVPLGKLTLENGQGLPSALTSLVPGGALVAVRVTAVDMDRVRGNAVGYVDPVVRTTPHLVPEWGNIGVPSVMAARADVTDLYRGEPPKKV